MLERELEAAITAAKKAEADILDIYGQPFDVEIKEDDSPVTQADKKADKIIRKYLHSIFPEDVFLTEESTDFIERLSAKRLWIVDPVDGTKEFVSRNGQFTTNIALCMNHEIVVGVINVPVLGLTYYAVKGQGAYRLGKDGKAERIHVSSREDNLIALRSVSHFKPGEAQFMERNAAHFEGEPIPTGAALKFARIAEGAADFFIRSSSGTKEWDVAPGDLILKEAGGFMCEPDGKDFAYNRQDVYNRKGYVMGNKRQPWMFD